MVSSQLKIYLTERLFYLEKSSTGHFAGIFLLDLDAGDKFRCVGLFSSLKPPEGTELRVGFLFQAAAL